MGANDSKEAAAPAAKVAKASFRSEERSQLSQCFSKISQGSQTVTFEQFQAGMRHSLTESIIERLFKEMAQIGQRLSSSKKPAATEEAMFVCAHHLLTASLDERAAAVVHLRADGDHVSQEQLLQLIRDLVSSYVLAESSSAEFQTWSFGPPERAKVELTEFLASELKSFAAADGSCSLHQLRKWMINSSVVLPLLDAVFRTAFELKLLDEEVNLRGFPMPTIPFCLGVDWRRMQSLLLVPSLFFLNQHLPNEHRRQWKLLFNSRVHGESFSKLANQTGGHGACVILVKSSDGCLFGAFASDGFVMGPSFVGDERSFLFTIEPRMAIYNATGYNNNFAYLNNHQQQMPNGLGMGGSIDSGFWSFFLDHEYGKGTSQARGTTFNSPLLANTPHFQLDTVEVWMVGTRRKPTPEEEDQRTSILDIDPEVKAMLAMTGRRMHSEGLRESDPTVSSPGDHEGPNFHY